MSSRILCAPGRRRYARQATDLFFDEFLNLRVPVVVRERARMGIISVDRISGERF